MSVYNSSFNYLGINSRIKGLMVSHFEADDGETETYLNLEPVYVDSASGVRRYDFGAKYNDVATFRITVIKSNGVDFNVTEVRDCLKWLTGTMTTTTLELLEGEEIKYIFTGRFTSVWQHKMDARTLGIVAEFTSTSPFAYSPTQKITRTISGTQTINIKNDTDDLFSYVYLNAEYTNTSGSSLVINNTAIEEETKITSVAKNETITINGPMTIFSDKQEKTFGNSFNFVFPRLKPGINELLITANGTITLGYRYPIKIGNVAADINDIIDCSKNPGNGTYAIDCTLWENIWNKPTTLAGYGIKTEVVDLINKSADVFEDKIENVKKELNTKIDNTKNELDTKINNTKNELNNSIAQTNTKIDNVETSLKNQINTTKTELNNSITQLRNDVDTKLTSVYKYMGSVANSSKLPTSGRVVGHVYNLEDTGMNVAWNGTGWDNLGSVIDLTPYLTKESAESIYATKDYVFTEINGLQIDRTQLENMLAEVLV